MKKNTIAADLVYSNKEKFAYIQLGKVGSSSVFRFLQNHTTLMSKPDSRHFIRSAYEFPLNNDIFKEINETHFTFMFVRNPWDRLVSFYKNKFREGFSKIHKISNPESICFKSFMGDFLINDPVDTDKHWCVQSNFSFISEINFIGKFENLQEDFDTICDKIGIERNQLPHKNATNHTHYTEYYDDETRSIVAEKYAKDIEYFGYKFGE